MFTVNGSYELCRFLFVTSAYFQKKSLEWLAEMQLFLFEHTVVVSMDSVYDNSYLWGYYQSTAQSYQRKITDRLPERNIDR